MHLHGMTDIHLESSYGVLSLLIVVVGVRCLFVARVLLV